MKNTGFLLVLLLNSPILAATLQSRLGVPFGVTANDNCSSSGNPSTLAAPVASFDAIIIQWSEMHALQSAVTARATRDRAAGLQVMLGISPTVLTGLRTDIDLPPWVANACGLTQNTASFANACLQSHFIADATTYAGAILPEYFHLGTEINTLILRKLAVPADNEFVFFGALYQTAAVSVKGVTPATRVFTSFQYELQTRLEQDNPGGWDNMLSAFRGTGISKLDYVGYTTYPSSSGFLSGLYLTPSSIPSGYYAAAAAHLQSPERVVFSEVGWPTQAGGSESAQRTYLDRLPELMSPANPALVTWALLHDVSASIFGGNNALASVGVRNCDGSPKSGWAILVGSVGQGSSSNPLGAIQVFPNPLRPARGHTAMSFTGLPGDARLRIYTLKGELVKNISANSFGNASWDGTNTSGKETASGVYVVYVQGGGNSRTLKVAVQR